jgi:hypothetical protein
MEHDGVWMPLRGALAMYAGAKLVRYGARLIAYGLRLERLAERGPVDYPRRPS